MRPLARTLVALIGVLASMEGEARATPKPRRPPSAQPAPKPKRRPPPVATPAPAAEADEAQRVRESADAATPPTVDVVTGPPTAPKAVGPIALDPERAKPPPIAAAAPERAKGTSGPEEPSAFTPPRTMWPVYAAGVVGLAGVTAAVVFGSLSDNARRAVEVADGALVRGGVTRARCAQPTAGSPFETACADIRRNEAASRSLGGALPVSLAIGLPALALAVGWYFLAPKESGAEAPGAEPSPSAARALPKVSTWVTATSGGASLEGRF